MWASSTLSGKGFSHRSGFHSNTSSPQCSAIRLAAMLLINTTVPFGTNISDINVPSRPGIGLERGRIVSSKFLINDCDERGEEKEGDEQTYVRFIIEAGAYLRIAIEYLKPQLETQYDSAAKAHSRSVSRHTASRNGRLTRSSYGTSPLALLACMISCLSLSWISGCWTNRSKIRERALEVVSVAVNTRVLKYNTWKGRMSKEQRWLEVPIQHPRHLSYEFFLCKTFPVCDVHIGFHWRKYRFILIWSLEVYVEALTQNAHDVLPFCDLMCHCSIPCLECSCLFLINLSARLFHNVWYFYKRLDTAVGNQLH